MTPTLRTVIKKIYKRTEELRRGFFVDNDWTGVRKVIDEIGTVIAEFNSKYNDNYECVLVNAAYCTSSDNTAIWKEYKLMLTDKKHNEVRYGVINCCAAGTIEDAFLKYDICLCL